jgi:competence protein ComEC
VLLLWPETLPGASFQMSFAAIVAIVVLHDHPRIRRLLERRDEAGPVKLGRFLLGLVLTGLAVEAALIPIALFHFHQAGLYGALANILAIPLTTFVIMPAEALALLFDTVGLGAAFWWVAGQALALLLGLAHRVAEAPGAVALLPAMPRGAFALMVGGGLWLCLWRTRWRVAGLAPFLLGAAWALATPVPNLLVTGDGQHLAIRAPQGLALLRPRAGDYVRDMLNETSGIAPEPLDIDSLPTAACSPDLCLADIAADGRSFRILATRSTRFVPVDQLARACAEADIAVSDRRLPRTCNPRWLKADRTFLARTGGLSLTLGPGPRVQTVAEQQGRHPWALAATAAAR